MTSKTSAQRDLWTAPATAAFEYWISFWPVAPLFGVKWRFGDWTAGFNPWAGFVSTPEKRAPARDKRAPIAPRPVTIALSSTEVKPAAMKPAAAMAPAAPKPAAAMAPAAPKPAAATAEAPTTEAPKLADDLTRIKGIGPGLAQQLNALGVQNFTQLAAMSMKELAALEAKLTTIKGRCFRDDWVGQAKALVG